MQIKYIFLVVLVIFSFRSVIAQQSDNSPYTRYGIGDLTDNNFNHSRQMSGLGASYIDGYHINIVNPASYSFLNSTAYDVGVFVKRTWLEDKNTTTKIWSGNLEYLSLAFPLRNPINDIYDGIKKKYKLGMSFTLMPHSNVSYNIVSQDSLQGVGLFARNYVGTGGTYKFLWGNSIKYKKISFGLNIGYLFGKIKNERNVVYESIPYSYNDKLAFDYNVKGFLWNAGLIYSAVLNEKAIENNKTLPSRRISIGLHANSATSFSTLSNIDERLVQQLPGGILNTDTINLKTDAEGKGKLPAEFGLGLTYYSGERSAIGFNYNTSFWSEYYNDASAEKAGALKNGSKVSVGGYFRPDYKSFDNFFERVYYRYGAYYHVDPRVVNNEQITAFGVTMGIGMPFVFQRKVSHINLGFNLGIRGQNTPISEKFVKISFGVTFNDDEWFLKRKYN